MSDYVRPSYNMKCPCSHIPLTDEQLSKVIKKYDSNGDRYLNKEDLKEVFRQLGSTARYGEPPEHTTMRISGDGRIDMTSELDQQVKYARKHGYTLASACCKK